MAELLALAGSGGAVTLQHLGVFGDPASGLLAGDEVELHLALRSWRACTVATGEERWLVVHEITAQERAASATIELARLRALAAAVGNLVHDFNNHLNAALGLASIMRPVVHDPRDLQVLDSLVVGTQQGAQLARSIARLLTKAMGDRSVVPAATVVDEAVAIATKAAAQRSVSLVVPAVGKSPLVRTIVPEAVQALWQGLLAVIERAPRRNGVVLEAMSQPLGGARVRSLARVRLSITGLSAPVAAELSLLVRSDPGMVLVLGRAPLAPSLATAALVQRRLGGDLCAATVGDQLQIDYLWPAIG